MMRNRRNVGYLLIASFATAFSSASMPSAMADDWPQWMGSQRDAVWRETGILSEFPEGGPEVKWRIPIGTGYAGPAVANGRVYLMDRTQQLDDDDQPVLDRDQTPPAFLGTERVFCVSAENGELIWEHKYDSPYQIQYQNGPRSTMMVEGDRVYAQGAMGDLFCFRAETGEIVWQKSFPKEYGAKPPMWGWASHPLIHGDKLLCTVGGEGSAVVAYNKLTGEELWKALTVDDIGYAPPVIYEADGKEQLIVWLDKSVESLDPETGRSYWSTPFPEDGAPQASIVTIMTPQFVGSQLLISNFYRGSLMLDVAADASGVTKVWGADPNDQNHQEGLNVVNSTPFYKDGHFYGVSGMGELRCVEADTGKVVWRDFSAVTDQNKSTFCGTCFLVQHEDRFFIFSEMGDLIIAELSPEGYNEIDRARVIEPDGFAMGRNVVWCFPAFADKKFFARNESELICVDLAAAAEDEQD